jgi:hypothetical protein
VSLAATGLRQVADDCLAITSPEAFPSASARQKWLRPGFRHAYEAVTLFNTLNSIFSGRVRIRCQDRRQARTVSFLRACRIISAPAGRSALCGAQRRTSDGASGCGRLLGSCTPSLRTLPRQAFKALLAVAEAAGDGRWRGFQARAAALAGRRARVRREVQDLERALWAAGVERRAAAQRAQEDEEGAPRPARLVQGARGRAAGPRGRAQGGAARLRGVQHALRCVGSTSGAHLW